MLFIQEGGFAMLLMLALAAGTVGVQVGAKRAVAVPGALAVLGAAVLGFGLGLWNVVAFVSTLAPADQGPTLLIGLREASNNLVLGGPLAAGLGLLALRK